MRAAANRAGHFETIPVSRLIEEASVVHSSGACDVGTASGARRVGLRVAIAMRGKGGSRWLGALTQ